MQDSTNLEEELSKADTLSKGQIIFYILLVEYKYKEIDHEYDEETEISHELERVLTHSQTFASEVTHVIHSIEESRSLIHEVCDLFIWGFSLHIVNEIFLFILI